MRFYEHVVPFPKGCLWHGTDIVLLFILQTYHPAGILSSNFNKAEWTMK
ncbi:MAG: hypothetical protein KAX28_05745 [Candidatus Marinimicrobia bacterium]|nr:hypothetical protein [Candidatus Neomarinimicrobiota bacterium]